MKNKSSYNGPERRSQSISDRRNISLNCLEHSGLQQKINSLESKIAHFETMDYLTTSSYRWTTGLLVSILITILSANIYNYAKMNENLRELKSSQLTLSIQIGYLQKDIEALKGKMK